MTLIISANGLLIELCYVNINKRIFSNMKCGENMEKIDLGKYNCTVEATMDIIGGKYKVIILWHLIKNGTLRFSEIQRLIPQATPKMLSNQLKELEVNGIVNRVLYPVVPPKTEYSLSELGRTLIPVITSLREWGIMYFEQAGAQNPCRK